MLQVQQVYLRMYVHTLQAPKVADLCNNYVALHSMQLWVFARYVHTNISKLVEYYTYSVHISGTEIYGTINTLIYAFLLTWLISIVLLYIVTWS